MYLDMEYSFEVDESVPDSAISMEARRVAEARFGDLLQVLSDLEWMATTPFPSR